MATRRSVGRLIGCLSVVFLLVGCSAGSATPPASANSTPSLTPTPSVAPSPSVTSSPSPSRPSGGNPANYPPDEAGVVVTGSLSCGADLTPSTTAADITTYTGHLECTHTMSDPRVSGSEVSDMTVVLNDQPGLKIDKWFYPTGTLTNDGGTWRASGWGSEFWDESDEIHTSGTSVYVGEGAYAGLVYRLLYAQGAGIGGGPIEYIAAGWIEPAT